VLSLNTCLIALVFPYIHKKQSYSCGAFVEWVHANNSCNTIDCWLCNGWLGHRCIVLAGVAIWTTGVYFAPKQKSADIPRNILKILPCLIKENAKRTFQKHFSSSDRRLRNRIQTAWNRKGNWYVDTPGFREYAAMFMQYLIVDDLYGELALIYMYGIFS